MEDAQRLVRLVEISDQGLRERLTGRQGEEAERERTAQAADLLTDVADRDLLGQALYLDTRMFLPASLLICGDKMSMAASLEQRVPFLDVELMRFVERIPSRARVRPRAGKRLHRQAMERLLPPEIAAAAQARLLEPVGRLAEGVAGARDREALRAGHRAVRAGGPPGCASRWSKHTARVAPTTAGSCSACSSCPSGTTRS